MMEQVLAPENPRKAWRRVKSNAPGVDGMSVEAFPASCREHWPRTRSALKSFFDLVPHNRLVDALRRKVRDRKVLGLIRRYLQAGVVLPDGTREATPQGVPRGGPLSPLPARSAAHIAAGGPANITLDSLDKELERRGHRFARYADDFLVKPRTRRRHLLALGIPREEVHMATRSRKGYWRMSANSIVQRALTNRWLHECAFAVGYGGTRHGVPDMRTLWITLHYGPYARV